MPQSRRARTVAVAGAVAVAVGLFTGPADSVAEAAPRALTIVGGGWGHGIGMSQHGARRHRGQADRGRGRERAGGAADHSGPDRDPGD
jgi:hypothetical protein